MAPVLFNVYSNAMVARWHSQSCEAGVPILYQHGRKLVADKTAKSWLLKVAESQFTDVLAMYAVTCAALVLAGKRFISLVGCFGLTVSLLKIKGRAVGSALSEDDASPVLVDGGEIEMVQGFTHLGSKLSCDGEITPELSCHRITRAFKAFGCLREPVFLNCTLSIGIKRGCFGLYFAIWGSDMDS